MWYEARQTINKKYQIKNENQISLPVNCQCVITKEDEELGKKVHESLGGGRG